VQLLSACGQTVEVGVDEPLVSAASGGDGALPIGGTASGGGGVGQAGAPCVITDCGERPVQCGNCEDDDQDGNVDALDPECLGPCDDDEVGLSTGMQVEVTENCRLDCYFDSDNGFGNDQCEWNHSCDPRSVPPDYPPSGSSRCAYDSGAAVDCDALAGEQAPTCLDKCLPLVPNGCDCFGCCELPDRQFHFVGRGRGEQGCQLDALDDAVSCPLCSPVLSCFNPCERCEVCVGTGLPDGCGAADACPPGQAACIDSNELCDFGEYCVTGCCVRAPEPI
jgi:hypothetical protein